ncbi:ZIP family metal transporter [Marinobacter sp. LV10MA510-1]|uniref:ZIP family metal transporter n=1 Tax=Marinobacter sp. LV10MA510-1 TaxID=1415567 RepID=UPI001E5D2415|nr:ZIP family metal transporter [Marinobacter sp. LV10MA510-1]
MSISSSGGRGRTRLGYAASGCSSSPLACITFRKAWRSVSDLPGAISVTVWRWPSASACRIFPRAAVAVSLLAIQHSRLKAFSISLLTGLVEPLGGLFGATMVWLAEPLMPWTLGFAAGAMLFIISDEIIPETHRKEHKTLATFSLLGGFVVMMFLYATLG